MANCRRACPLSLLLLIVKRLGCVHFYYPCRHHLPPNAHLESTLRAPNATLRPSVGSQQQQQQQQQQLWIAANYPAINLEIKMKGIGHATSNGTCCSRWYYCYLLLHVLTLRSRGSSSNFAAATEDRNDYPAPPISACKYSQLRFSHIDDIFGACRKDDGDTDLVGTDALWEEEEANEESIADTYKRAAWEFTVSHGWEMAESLTTGGDSLQTDSAFVIGEKEERDSDAVGPGIDAAYPFLVCSQTETALSGYDNLRDLLPMIGAISGDVAVLSNKPKESCFMVSTTAPSARNAAVSWPNLMVLPMTDVSSSRVRLAFITNQNAGVK